MLISKKLFFLAFFSVLALFIVGGTGIYSATQEANALKNLSERSVPGLHLMHSIRSTQQQIALVLFRHFQTSDPKVKSDLENNMEKLAGDLQKDFANYESKIRTDKGRELYAAEKVKLTEYLEMLSKYLAVLRSGGTATDLSGPMGGKRAELAKLLDEHLELNIATATKEAQTATVAASRSVVISIIMIVLALLVIGWISFSVIQSIRRSLEEIQRTMAMVEGSLDFKARAKVLGHDEIAMVSAGLNRLLDKLSSSFSSIARHTHSISRSSSDMASSAEQVARASTSQSDAASAMAAGVEEMTVSINHISDRSTEARELTTRSGDLARNGVKVINETVEDIGAIAQSVNHVSARIRELETHGNRISTIVSVIKDVAEQTNLLALNAAIEAARAGEQGRGFAVVADEVRKLAERTSGSTLEISSMVDAIRAVSIDASSSMVDAVQMVEAGVQRAGVAREAIQQINLGSTESLRMVEEIACAIQEQSEASTNIAAHVERIAQMAEESSAAAKHSAETAFGLDTLAREMQGEISNYKL